MVTEEEEFEVVVIGCGFSGICAAYELKKIGVNFIVLERGESYGGTWFFNKYPGCACDVPICLYSFSFKPLISTEVYESAPVILKYLHDCCEEFGLNQHIRCNRTVKSTTYDSKSCSWNVIVEDTKNKKTFTIRSKFVISATGLLNVPRYPDIPGRDKLTIPIMHTAEWDSSIDLTGKRVGLIGNGSSGVQTTEVISSKVKNLFLFNRSPKWLSKKPQTMHSNLFVSFCSKFYFLSLLYRIWTFIWIEFFGFMVLGGTFLAKKVQETIARSMREGNPNSPNKKTFVPKFSLGCNRIIFYEHYTSDLERENVTVVTDGIKTFTENGIQTIDDKVYTLDAIILATGFKINNCLPQYEVIGRNGIKLQDEWKVSPKAYYGMTTTDLPNFFFVYGPNTNTVIGSITFFTECACKYIAQCVKYMKEENMKEIELKKEVLLKYNLEVQKRLLARPESEGCSAWYKPQNSSVQTKIISPTNYPASMTEYWWNTRKFNPSHYITK